MEVEKFSISKTVFVLFSEIWDTSHDHLVAPSKLLDLESCESMDIVQDLGTEVISDKFLLPQRGPDLMVRIFEVMRDNQDKWRSGNAPVAIHPTRVLSAAVGIGAMRRLEPSPLKGEPIADMCEWFYGNTTLTFGERSSFGLETLQQWLLKPGEDEETTATTMAKVWRTYKNVR